VKLENGELTWYEYIWDETKEKCCGNHHEAACEDCPYTDWDGVDAQARNKKPDVKKFYNDKMKCPTCAPPDGD
jgi:hypothetical protein